MVLAERSERETEYEDYRSADWRVMARLQSKAERHQRCAFEVSGRPCGARPDVEPAKELAALTRHLSERHLGGQPSEVAMTGGAAEHIGGTFAYLYYLGDGRLWCFAGSDREWADWMNGAPRAVESTPAAAEQYAF